MTIGQKNDAEEPLALSCVGNNIARYSAIRDFVEKRHDVSFASFMASRRGKCMTVKTLSRWTLEERNLLLSDFNLMGAFLW